MRNVFLYPLHITGLSALESFNGALDSSSFAVLTIYIQRGHKLPFATLQVTFRQESNKVKRRDRYGALCRAEIIFVSNNIEASDEMSSGSKGYFSLDCTLCVLARSAQRSVISSLPRAHACRLPLFMHTSSRTRQKAIIHPSRIIAFFFPFLFQSFPPPPTSPTSPRTPA